MRELSYSGGFVLTSDGAAEAVLAYAAALANHNRAATVQIPAAQLPGGSETVEMLLGPASQLTSAPVDSDEPDPESSEFIAEMSRLIAELDFRRVPPSESSLDYDF